MAENKLETGSEGLSQHDGLDVPLVAPVGKLDADQYSSDDLDGVTESLFGSGNMAYASLQASQTNAALDANESFPSDKISSTNTGTGDVVSFSNTDTDTSDDTSTGRSGERNFDGSQSNTDQSLGHQAGVTSAGVTGGDGNFSSSTVGSVGASQLAFDGAAIGGSGPNLTLGDTMNDASIDISETVTSLTTSIKENVESLTEVLNNLTGANLTDVSEITNQINDIGGDLTENIQNTLNQLGDITQNPIGIVNDISAGDVIQNVLEGPVTDIANGLGDVWGVEVLGDVMVELGDTTQSLGSIIDQIVETANNLDIPDAGNLGTGLADTLGNLGDSAGSITSTVTDSVNSYFSELSGADPEIFSDTQDIGIDSVDDIIGVDDLGIAADTDVQVDQAASIVDDGTDGTSEDTPLAAVGDTLDDAAAPLVDNSADTFGGDDFDDISVDADLDISDDVAFVDAEQPVDLADSSVSEETDNWTESTIESDGGLFDDIVDGIGGEVDALPDPGGTVAEGLGVLDVEPDLDAGSLGGMFG